MNVKRNRRRKGFESEGLNISEKPTCWDETIIIVHCVSVYLLYRTYTGKPVAATSQLAGIKVFISMRSWHCLPQIKSSVSATTPVFPSLDPWYHQGNLARNGILTWFNKIKMNGSCQGRVQINCGQAVKKIILIQFLSFDLF